jgi:hypothetical protein
LSRGWCRTASPARKAAQDVGEGIRVAELLDPYGNALGLIENPHFDAAAVR